MSAEKKRIRDEQLFHDERFGQEDPHRKTVNRFYDLTYQSSDFFKSTVLTECRSKKILEYGCGTGSSSFLWAEKGALVMGIDISQEGIKRANEEAKKKKLDIQFRQMNAEAMDFKEKSFDRIAGSGILHHLDLKKSLSELSRVLKPDGFAVFLEPLGHNPIINLFRRFTPKMRTVDEHPFLMRDFELAKKYFKTIEVNYYYLFVLLALPFNKFSFSIQLEKWLYGLDKALFRLFPFLKKHSWLAVIIFRNPRPPTP